MPLYRYRDEKTGTELIRMVPIAQRDCQPGLARVPEFPTGRLGLAENPHTQEYGVRRGLRDMEESYGTAEIQRQLGTDIPLRTVKKIWRN